MYRIFLMAVLLVLCAFAAAPPARLYAQDADANAEAKADVKADQAPTSPGDQKASTIGWVIRASGLIGLFILMLSIYFVATVIRLFIEMRHEVAMPPEFIKHCNELIERRDFPAIYTAVQEDDSFLSRTLSAGLAELPHGLPEARDVMERVGEVETVEMEKRISMLAVLGTLGPMIGLIGTLKGMISSFSVIAMYDVQLKSSQVAGGISEALLLTFEGVALSVPAIYFYAVFRNRVASISAAALLEADHLLRKFAHAVRQKPSATQLVAPPK